MQATIDGLLADLRRTRAHVATQAGASCRPFVTLAYAQSVDGSIALDPGRPFRLSGPEALRLTHALRAAHDCILVGIGTVLADDPQLTVRLVEGQSPRPVVVDSHLRTPATARLVGEGGRHGRGAWIATTDGAEDARRGPLEDRGAVVLRVPAWENGWVDLPALLRQLAAQGVSHLMVEGGAKVITSFLRSRLVDFVVITVAPRLIGGLSALGGLNHEPALGMNGVLPGGLPHLRRWESRRMGDDLVLSGELRWASE
jgi:3,4-dihydroxy 2-butanone 4-phosphate synthase/GTP cyclohydrolase II